MLPERNCRNCAYDERDAYEYPCNKCESAYDCPPSKWEPADKPQTNADHIRGMTDEELAELLSGMCQANADGESNCDECSLRACCPGCGFEDEWLDWLQQPYKEDVHG